jgi:HAD superfamily hydrolase (TIGR01509 family)
MENFQPTAQTLENFPVMSQWGEKLLGIKAVFFDMDGTLFNTEPMHANALWSLIEDKGLNSLSWERGIIEKPEDFEVFKGMSDDAVFSYLSSSLGSEATELIDKKNKWFEKNGDTLHEYFPQEIKEFLLNLKEKGIKLALVSASQREVIDLFLKELDMAELFDVTIGASDVKNAKPSPEPYERAMLACGVTPREVVIFEDSLPGLQSAEASGARAYRAAWF